MELVWTVHSLDNNKKVTYSPASLIHQFAGKLESLPDRPDQQLLIDHIVETLPSNSYREMSIHNFITLGFALGYLYRLFLEKNNVELPSLPNNQTNTTTNIG